MESAASVQLLQRTSSTFCWHGRGVLLTDLTLCHTPHPERPVLPVPKWPPLQGHLPVPRPTHSVVTAPSLKLLSKSLLCHCSSPHSLCFVLWTCVFFVLLLSASGTRHDSGESHYVWEDTRGILHVYPEGHSCWVLCAHPFLSLGLSFPT